jgi:hypothetical protein
MIRCDQRVATGDSGPECATRLMQIEHGATVKTIHPVDLLLLALGAKA